MLAPQAKLRQHFTIIRNRKPFHLSDNIITISLLTESKVTALNIHEFRRGQRDAIPVLLGFIPFALVLGAQATQKGLPPYMVALMTGINFAGGSEFTAVELWTSPPHILLIVSMSLLVNIRHVLMGAVIARYLRHLPKRKAG